MYRNFLKSSVRSLVKDRLNSSINLFGLSVGLSCSILIYLYVKNELSFDQFHAKGADIYRVYTLDSSKNGDQFQPSTSALLGPEMINHIPEVMNYVRMTESAAKVTLDGNMMPEELSLFDSAFFEMFTFKVLKGSLINVLEHPTNLILTEETAKKYFGDNDPIGAQLQIKIALEAQWFTVKAVIENPPPNSSIDYSMITAYENAYQFIPEDIGKSWFTSFGETYVLLKPGTDKSQITEKMIPVMKTVLGEKYKEGDYQVHLQPFNELHFANQWENDIIETSDMKYVFIISGVALLILLLASINFTTLSIGKSFARAKEVGIRKVVGSSQIQIIGQFLGESVLLTYIGFAIALFLASFTLPWFNQLSGVELTMDLGLIDILAFLLFGLLVGVLSGSYPAFLISRLQSYKILKGDFGGKIKKHNLRKGLVVVQYVIAIAFISTTLLMLQQIRFLMERDLGFDREQLIHVTYESDISKGLKHEAVSAIEKAAKIKKVFEGVAGVAQVGFSTNQFNGDSWIRVGSAEKGKKDDMEVFSATFIDPGFIPAMQIELVEGRNFSEMNGADYKNAVLVNEALVKKMGWDNPLDQQLPGRYASHEVIGVVKDFNYESMRIEIRPLYMTMNPEFMFEAINHLSMSNLMATNIYIKIKAGEVQSTISKLEEASMSLYPNEAFDYQFVDASIQAQYEKERNINKIISTATLLAIIISSLGLFGLTYLTLNARTKEIGIRKSLGASFGGMFIHLTKDYIILILIATILAIPIAYFSIQKWLEEFEFRITVMPQHFIPAIVLTLVLSMLTISYLTIKSARSKPVDGLRCE
jgi:putative ABC transport system permease protein